MIIAVALICGMIFDLIVLGAGFYTTIILHRSVWWLVLSIVLASCSGLNVKYVLNAVRGKEND